MVKRLLNVVVGFFVLSTSTMAGVGAGCTMAVHCGGCPDGATAASWRAPLPDCPLIFAASPESEDRERVPSGSTGEVVLLPETFGAPMALGDLAHGESLLAIRVAPKPPGHAVLRI